MTTQDEYLKEVRRSMMGMEPAVREDILRELRSHMVESMAANGGNVVAALSGFGSPHEVGRHYRELYGYGRAFRFLFVVMAFLLAIPSIPVLVAGEASPFPSSLSLAFLGVVAAWILWVSVAAGSRTGLLAGVAGFAGRAVAFGAAATIQPGAVATAAGIGLLVIVSSALVLLGWLPGTAKKSWGAPKIDL